MAVTVVRPAVVAAVDALTQALRGAAPAHREGLRASLLAILHVDL